MALSVNDLTEDEQLEYWNQLELYARRGREMLRRTARLRERLQENRVSQAAEDEVLTKETARLEGDRGPQPTPDNIRNRE